MLVIPSGDHVLKKHQHFKASTQGQEKLSDLALPFTFCSGRRVKVRLPRNHIDNETTEWGKREETWTSFWKQYGTEGLQRGGNAFVDGLRLC